MFENSVDYTVLVRSFPHRNIVKAERIGAESGMDSVMFRLTDSMGKSYVLKCSRPNSSIALSGEAFLRSAKLQESVNWFLTQHGGSKAKKGGAYGLYVPEIYESGTKNGISFALIEDIASAISLKEMTEKDPNPGQIDGKLTAAADELVTAAKNYILKEREEYKSNPLYKKFPQNAQKEEAHRAKIFEFSKAIDEISEIQSERVKAETIDFDEVKEKLNALSSQYHDCYASLLASNPDSALVKQVTPEKMQRLCENILSQEEVIKRHNDYLKTAPLEFSHSDVHFENILFDKANKRFVLIDFDEAGMISPPIGLLNKASSMTHENVEKKMEEYVSSRINEGALTLKDMRALRESLVVKSLYQVINTTVNFLQSAIDGDIGTVEKIGDPYIFWTKKAEKAIDIASNMEKWDAELPQKYEDLKSRRKEKNNAVAKKAWQRMEEKMHHEISTFFDKTHPNAVNLVALGSSGEDRALAENLNSLPSIRPLYLDFSSPKAVLEQLNGIVIPPEAEEINFVLPGTIKVVGQPGANLLPNDLGPYMVDINNTVCCGMTRLQMACFLGEVIKILSTKVEKGRYKLNLNVIACGYDSPEVSYKRDRKGMGLVKSKLTFMEEAYHKLKHNRSLPKECFKGITLNTIQGAHAYVSYLPDVWAEMKQHPEKIKSVCDVAAVGVNNFLLGGSRIWTGIGYKDGRVPAKLIEDINSGAKLITPKHDYTPAHLVESKFKIDKDKPIEHLVGGSKQRQL